MSDINEVLRNTVTAREEPSSSSTVLAAGRKRGRTDTANAPVPSSQVRPAAPLKPAVGLDMTALAHDLAAERARRGGAIRDSYNAATRLSEEAASRMAFRLLDYVMKDQLGGKHNAVVPSSSSPPSAESLASRALDLVVEGSTLRAIAAFDVSYVCSASLSAGGPRVSTRKDTPAPAAIVSYRKLLRPCNLAVDLVGGLTAGLPPHSRQHWQRTVEAALRGEAHDDAQEAHSTSLQTSAVTMEEDGRKSSAPIDLFAPSASDAAGSAVTSRVPDDRSKAHFSVTDFLNDTESDDSSHEDG